MSTRSIVLALAFLVATDGQGAEPKVRVKTDAPADLRAVFTVQEDTESRRATDGLKLARRILFPSTGIESPLLARRISKEHPALVLIAMDRFPSSGEWANWAASGLTYVRYSGQKHWLVQLTGDARAAYEMTQAEAFVEFRTSDKVAPVLDNFEQREEFFDSERHLVVLNIVLVPGTRQDLADKLREEFHHQGVEHVRESDGARHLTLVTHPSNLDRLKEMPQILDIQPGAWKTEFLMDGVRAVARGDDVMGGDGELLTGQGIRAATHEDLGCGWVGKGHDAFWNHDAAGNKTTPRYTDLADQTGCGLNFEEGWHGMMTGGILLGNGWNSGVYVADPFAFRGIAPEATLDCYAQSGAHPHVSSHSYKGGPPNSTVVGASTDERHHAHVVALGNSGLVEDGCGGGYFSVCNAQKNLLGVANAQVNGEIYAGSSAGPTDDDRLKPDLAAPTGNANITITAGGFSVEVGRVQIIRDGAALFDWNFLSATAEGWGQTQSNIGRAGVEVLPFHGRIKMVIEEAVPGEDWGGWGGTPVVGTEVDRYGNLIDFVGQEDDVLRVEYRAHGLGYFDFKPTWFRDHPYVEPELNCDVDPVKPASCPWKSQSFHGGIGIGDGEWRTMDIPVGQAGDWNSKEVHPFWDDEQTWAGEPIQFLGFRFKYAWIQPTPQFPQYYNVRSGGTSGASPVLGGAYALAMENLTRLYSNVDLDARLRRSVYYASPWTSPPYGMPINSTWKALFVHTADDMIRTSPATPVPPNPDTGVPNVYHAGPDYTTGYGMVDIQSAIDLMNMDAAEEPLFDVVELELREGGWHTYELPVSDLFAAGDQGLKATLVWDDPPNWTSVVNNLSLILQAPDGSTFYPWSLKVLEQPVTAEGILPAERNQPNDRDNIEQVLVDDVSNTHGGIWKVHVTDSGMGEPQFVQKYSLVISPWNVDGQCHTCGYGRVSRGSSKASASAHLPAAQ